MWQNPIGNDADWCAGGNRTWLSPEFASSGSTGRGLFEDEAGSWRVPPGLDPGPYTTQRLSGTEWSGTTTVWTGTNEPPVELRRSISIGYAEEYELSIRIDMELRNLHPRWKTGDIGLWVITQVLPHANARITVPLRGDVGERSSLWSFREGTPETRDISVRSFPDHHIQVRPRADRRFKIGVDSRYSDGRVVYTRDFDHGISVFVEHRPHYETPDRHADAAGGARYLDYGDIVQVFNSNMEEDGARFAEIETHWPGGVLPPRGATRGTIELLARIAE